MRKLSVIFCLFASFVLSANAMAGENVASPRKRVVVLDAGHGGIRSGAYRSNICEKDINLAVAKETKRQLLEKMDNVEVYLTRDTDTQLHENKTTDNRRRALFANEKGSDLFVSLHADAAGSSSVTGPTVYLLSFDERLLAQNRDLATRFVEDDDMINIEDMSRSSMGYILALSNQMNNDPLNHVFANALNAEFKTHKRHIREIRYNIWTVLYWLEGPGALVELGYMTNPQELAYMNSAEGQRELADALSDAIVKFLENLNAMQQYTENIDGKEQGGNTASATAITTATTTATTQPDKSPEGKPADAAKVADSDKGFAIQLLSSKTVLDVNDSQFKVYRGRVVMKEGEGSYKYKYCLAGYATAADAKAELSAVRQHFKDAYIVQYEAGRIKTK